MITDENQHSQSEKTKMINLRTHRAAEHLLNIPINKDIPLRISCECGQVSCDSLITIPFAELKNIRKNKPHSYIVIPSHCDEEHYKIMTSTDTYSLITKKSA